ncbi:MAG: PstS family phosphate ABC transporter substrate-binding protein [Chitinophagaceae bacterium]
MKFISYICLIVVVLSTACNNQDKNKQTPLYDTFDFGTINISVDESFKPVIEEQLQMYHFTYPNTNIKVSYKSEVECFKDLLKDSVRMIISARSLSKKEFEIFKNNLGYEPKNLNIAYDAVAAIVNTKNKDSIFSYNDLVDILSGKKNYQVILDGNNATSTVKYLSDSVLRGKPFGKNVVATNGSDSVIALIKKNENAIGFVSNCWISNPFNEQQVEHRKKVKLALVECKICDEPGTYAKATQATLMYGQYPLARPLYYIIKESSQKLGTGFGNFLKHERGQLIFKRAGLAPAVINFNKRATRL